MTDLNNNVFEKFDIKDHPHVRFNPLIGEYILVCPNRTKRPWSGLIEKDQDKQQPCFDSNDPLCPGTTRPSGEKNLNYTSTYVFQNDYPALIENNFDEKPEKINSLNNLDDENFDFFKATPVGGTCRVICFHPRHDLTLTSLDKNSFLNVINLWIEQILDLQNDYEHIQIFENKGEILGCSNPHPHGQIWASNFLPNEIIKKNDNLLKYYQKHKTRLLDDYIEKEFLLNERIILKNDHFVILVPFWSYWPFETMILPYKRNIQRLTDLNEDEKNSLADILKKILIKYDNLFECSFPYAFGWHGAPTGSYLNNNTNHWTLHGVFYPPLLRSSKIKKFVASYELLAMPQRDLTPESAAEKLRSMSEIHYTNERISS